MATNNIAGVPRQAQSAVATSTSTPTPNIMAAMLNLPQLPKELREHVLKQAVPRMLHHGIFNNIHTVVQEPQASMANPILHTTSPSTAATMSCFSQLPKELRENVFKQAVQKVLHLGIFFRDYDNSSARLICLNARDFEGLGCILAVSRQTQKDASQAIREAIEENITIVLDFTSTRSSPCPAHLLAHLCVQPPAHFLVGARHFQLHLPVAFEPRANREQYYAEDPDNALGRQDLVGTLTVHLARQTTYGTVGRNIEAWKVTGHDFKAIHLPADFHIFIGLKEGIQETANYISKYIMSSRFTVHIESVLHLKREVCSFVEFPQWEGQAIREDVGPFWRKLTTAEAIQCHYAIRNLGEAFCEQIDSDPDGKLKRAEEMGVSGGLKRRKSMGDVPEDIDMEAVD